MDALIALVILVIAFFSGKITEIMHYKSIRKREAELGNIPVVTFKTIPGKRQVAKAALVTGSVVISVDHFKRFLMFFRQIFGGEIKAYASLVDRGRREAILRMRERATAADMFINLRVETSTISNGQGKAIGCVEVIAYSTALKFEK